MIPQLLLSLDYELFFGPRTGTVEHCLIRPTQKVAEIAERHGARLSLFVDVLYLQRLTEEAHRFPRLQNDLDAIRKQLVSLKGTGHDIQLHLHPHWLDSSFDGEQWNQVTTRYKLHDFSAAAMATMVGSAKELLTRLIGNTVFAFRAGGWCMQPFAQIAPALLAHSIWLDSTVFAGGISDDKDRWFDFSSAPVKDSWRFSEDPNHEDPQGQFVEVPISAMRVTPLLFWRMVVSRKLLPQTDHQPFGDGSPMVWGNSYFLKRLTSSTISVASMDGFKAGLLTKAFSDEQATAPGKQLFHAMGHPKALTPYSLMQLNKFLAGLKAFTGVTFQDFKHLQPKSEAHEVSHQ
ncbi:MAG: hypothetical protein FD168_185 [Desulfobulbaceae bacterium]|nr:MAG: hypothetical protein FD168_185 [Desulfobulbaceae bacterium]